MKYTLGTSSFKYIIFAFAVVKPSIESIGTSTIADTNIETECYRFGPDEKTSPFESVKNIDDQYETCEKITIKSASYPKKAYTLMIYIAADNDLHYFAWNNIKQLAKGANENMHIIVQLNEPGANKKTQRYLIEKNKAILLNKEGKLKLNSGDPKTLYDFCADTINMFPADHYVLDLSNHGSGSIDRKVTRLVNSTDLFYLNPTNLMLELDRKIEYLDYLQKKQYETAYRGICFDETFRSYLTNKQLQTVLEQVSQNCLGGDKVSMVWMDACLMAGIEVAALLKTCCNIMIASEEVELGPGWRYDKVLKPFSNGAILDEDQFSQHIVKCYEETYANITNEYTLSAIRLNKIEELEKSVDRVGALLEEFLDNQESNCVKRAIKKCKSRIGFEEPSYVDLAAFYKKIMENIRDFKTSHNNESIKDQLLIELDSGLRTIQGAVIENVAGNNVSYAKGISIYLPERGIHQSYIHSDFAKSNRWASFISSYLS